MLVADERLKARDFVDRLKLSLVTHDPRHWVPSVFPDLVKAPEPVVTEDIDEALASTGPVEYVFDDIMSPEEVEEYEKVLSQKGGSFSVEEWGEWK